MLSEKTIEILENNDMRVYDRTEQDGSFLRDVEFWSSEGEDVCETIWYDGTDAGFIEAFKKNAEDFDADEHAEMWIEHRNSVNGVPKDIRVLIDDAEDIKKTLLSVANKLEYRNHHNLEEEEPLPMMDEDDFIAYVEENYTISGEAGRLICNILSYVKGLDLYDYEQFDVLYELLDGTIGLSEEEIRRIRL